VSADAPPPENERHAPTCWECDALTAQIVNVLLPSPSNRAIMVPLCASCQRDIYLPLIAETQPESVSNFAR
jgi:hypothetical protein